MQKYQDTCCALIKQINDRLEKFANNTLRKEDLTMMQIAVLVELDSSDKQEASLKTLEQIFGVSQPTMYGIVRRLEQKGLVETYPSPHEKRTKIVKINDAGKAKCTFGYGYMAQSEAKLLKALSEDEQATLHDLLDKINASL